MYNQSYIQQPFSSTRSRLLQRACPCGQHMNGEGECAECQGKHEGTLQRAAVTTTPTQAVPPIVHDTLQAPGQQLDADTRTFMESRFQHDFSGVRVHTDARAEESTQAVQAHAYTVGQDIVFAQGQYAPATSEGKKLLAHELTHVVQQDKSAASTLPIGAVNDASEHEAKAISHQISSGNNHPGKQHIKQHSSSVLQRDINYDLYIKGENYWFTNQGQARIAALARATQLGLGYTIKHHPVPAVGLPHYHIIDITGRQVAGHFFYGRNPPIKEREQSRYRERAKEREPKKNAREEDKLDIQPVPPIVQPQPQSNTVPTEASAQQHAPEKLPEQKSQEPISEGWHMPSYETIRNVMAVLGISLLLIGVVIAALFDPEPASKLALAGLSLVVIGQLLKMLGRKPPTEA
jgi:Domain of unknown function (DUF4157)